MQAHLGFVVFDTLSPWWLIVCFLLGLGYALFQYWNKKSEDLSIPVKSVLFVFRFLSISLISILILSPIIELKIIRSERPVIVLAQDNSSSIASRQSPLISTSQFNRNFKALASSLSKEYEVKTYSFGSKITESLESDFKEKETDLSSLFSRVYGTYENLNLGAIIIATDGIVNKGANPSAIVKNHSIPVYTIALGDTSQVPDAAVTDIAYNDIVYQGEPFTLDVFLHISKAKGQHITFKIETAGKIVFSKVIEIKTNDQHVEVPATLLSSVLGFSSYSVSVNSFKGERNTINNRKEIVLETLKSKLKILLLAGSPHPDLSFLKQVLEGYKRSEVDLVFAGETNLPNIKNYDLLILHQFPFANGSGDRWTNQIAKTKIPVWFIFGSQTDVQAFNSIQKDVLVLNAEVEKALKPAFNPSFTSFILSDSAKKQIETAQPLLGPFGSYRVHNLGEMLLKAKSESDVFKKEEPLFFFTNSLNGKVAYLMGEGLWRWNLKSFYTNGNQSGISEIIQKTVQYLTSESDKRKFRIFMPERVYGIDESPEFKAELLNDNFEKINEPEALLEIHDVQKHNYTYSFSKTTEAYSLHAGPFPAGEYTYKGKVNLKGHYESATGSFFVRSNDLEGMDIIANHKLLAEISLQTKGAFLNPDQLDKVLALLRADKQIASIFHEEENQKEAINIKWIFFLIISLLSLEWFSRKWNGFL